MSKMQAMLRSVYCVGDDNDEQNNADNSPQFEF